MKRGVKVIVALFVLAARTMFAAALAGGLMDESAFVPAVKGARH